MIIRVQGCRLKLLENLRKPLKLGYFLVNLTAGSNFDAGFLRQMAGRTGFEHSVPNVSCLMIQM